MSRSKWTMGLTLAAALTAGSAFSGMAAAQPDRPEARRNQAKQDEGREQKQNRGGEDARGQERQGDGPRRSGPDRANLMRSLLRGIDLSEEQRTEIREIMQEHGPASPAARERHKQLAEIHQQMRQARQENDREKFVQLAGQLFDVLGEAPDHEALHDKLRDVLTPEQREQFDENLAAMKERMKQRGKDRVGPHDDERPAAQRRERDGEGDGPRARRDERRRGGGTDDDQE